MDGYGATSCELASKRIRSKAGLFDPVLPATSSAGLLNRRNAGAGTLFRGQRISETFFSDRLAPGATGRADIGTAFQTKAPTNMPAPYPQTGPHRLCFRQAGDSDCAGGARLGNVAGIYCSNHRRAPHRSRFAPCRLLSLGE